MHGCGNDYIYVNTMEFTVPNPAAAAIAWSDRHKGIGSDGLVLIGKSPVPEADYTMHIYNADGSEAMMCGNASRCIGKYLYERRTHPWPLPVKEGNGYQETEIRLLTLSGVKILHLHIVNDIVEYVTEDMGEPVFEDETLFNPTLATSLSTPLPHREGPGVGPLIEILANAPRRIAAHHRFAAVGIEDTHRKVSLRHWRCSYQHQPVRTDTPMAVAPYPCHLRRVRHCKLHRIDIDVVVTATIHLRKPDFLCHTATFT